MAASSSQRRTSREAEKKFSGPSLINDEEIKLKKKIGEGCFGKVYRGTCRAVEVAIKVPNKQSFDPKQLAAFKHEVEIMSKIYHPNVCLFMGACTVPGKVKIVTELMGGDLETLLLDKRKELSLPTVISMAKDAALGMAWLHGNNPPVYHRDLKTANLLYDTRDNMKIKVCDFGLSETIPQGKERYDRQPKGTPLYMAPEVMKQERITEKVDVYSFGIILWEMYTREEAYTEFDDYETFYKNVVEENYRPAIPRGCPQALAELMQQCWAAEPEARPSFESIVESLEKIRQAAVQSEAERHIEKSIGDEVCRNFWKRNFLHQRSVHWNTFAPLFYKQVVGTPIPTERPLPEQPSLEQIREASFHQLDQFALLNSDAAALALEERERRRIQARQQGEGDSQPSSATTVGTTQQGGQQHSSGSTPLTVPDGYENQNTSLSNSSPSPTNGASNYVSQPDMRRDVILDEDTCKCFCLKSLLADDEDMVLLRTLGRTLSCFGPCETPPLSEATGPTVLDRIRDLMSEPYFHGFLSARAVENLLRVLPRGTYLVRFSNNSPRSFCISKVSQRNIIRHIVVPRDEQGWRIDRRHYPSIQELIKAVSDRYYLRYPCQGSSFSWIFEDDAAALGGYGADSVEEIQSSLKAVQN